jgi:hypothetical protein
VPNGHDADLAAARPLYDTELSLVIDQRYDDGDMHRIADALTRAGAAPL